MPTSRVKTNLFLIFEIATKWQNVGYTRRSYMLMSLNQPIRYTYIYSCVNCHSEYLGCYILKYASSGCCAYGKSAVFKNRYDVPVPVCFKEFSATYYHICSNIYGIKSFILNNPILYVFLCVK